MKKYLVNFLALAALLSAPLAVGTVSAQTVQDDIQDAQCQSGETMTCIDPNDGIDPAATGECTDGNCNIVKKYLDPFIQFLSVMAGVAVVIGIIIGGIQYAGSAGDPQKVAVAKNRIRNSIVALIIFFFLYALLRFLIPGTSLLVT